MAMLTKEQRAFRDAALVRNLRLRWRAELEPFSDEALVAAYEAFAISDDYGDNDERFPLWFDLVADLEAIIKREGSANGR